MKSYTRPILDDRSGSPPNSVHCPACRQLFDMGSVYPEDTFCSLACYHKYHYGDNPALNELLPICQEVLDHLPDAQEEGSWDHASAQLLRKAIEDVQQKFTLDELTFNGWHSLALEHRKLIHYCRADGQWYWSDKGDAEKTENWHGPFYSYFRALHDAIEPYLPLEPDTQELTLP